MSMSVNRPYAAGFNCNYDILTIYKYGPEVTNYEPE